MIRAGVIGWRPRRSSADSCRSLLSANSCRRGIGTGCAGLGFGGPAALILLAAWSVRLGRGRSRPQRGPVATDRARRRAGARLASRVAGARRRAPEPAWRDCGINSSPTSQPSTSQMTSRSSSLTLVGVPDHSPDILPAEITSPCSASLRCSSFAFQTPRLAAANRKFHFMTAPLRVGRRPTTARRSATGRRAWFPLVPRRSRSPPHDRARNGSHRPNSATMTLLHKCRIAVLPGPLPALSCPNRGHRDELPGPAVPGPGFRALPDRSRE